MNHIYIYVLISLFIYVFMNCTSYIKKSQRRCVCKYLKIQEKYNRDDYIEVLMRIIKQKDIISVILEYFQYKKTLSNRELCFLVCIISGSAHSIKPDRTLNLISTPRILFECKNKQSDGTVYIHIMPRNIVCMCNKLRMENCLVIHSSKDKDLDERSCIVITSGETISIYDFASPNILSEYIKIKKIHIHL